MKVESVTLEGQFVQLQPMTLEHLPALIDVGLDERLWRWTANEVNESADLERYVQAAFADRDKGTSLPFVTIDRTGPRIVGSTRFGNIDIPNRKVEIGWSWINPLWQRTAVNTEAKLLMLTHAFEVWKCIRVELKTDANNAQSRNAISRLGAVQEGIFRNHMITETGRYRDTVYFSIVENEWPDVKNRLVSRLSGV